MTDKNESMDDWKGVIALLVLVIYIGASVWFWGFNWSYLFALITIFMVIFGASIQSVKTIKGRVVKAADGTPEKVLNIFNIIALVVWAAAFIAVVFNIYQDYYGRLVFVLFSAALSTSMKPKDIILFLGLSLLTALFFESGVLASMVLIVTALFAYGCRQSAAFGAIMMVPLLMVGWLIGSGYGEFISQKVDGFSTQLSVTTGISTEGIGDQIAFMFNDTWLLLTNPNAWYDKQNAVQGTQTDGSLALEITKIEALPSSVISKDNFDVVFEFENKGQKTAEDVVIGATAETLADACGKIEGKFCNPICIEEGTAPASCGMNRTIEKVSSQEKRFETVNFQAPECPGTYSTEAVLKYKYDVDATVNLQMISREYYEELLRNKKLVTAPELSEASAGPFKLTLKTSRDQPIPDTETDTGKMQKFKIYLGMVNQRSGEANMTYATLKLPKSLMLVGWDEANNRVDESCISGGITYGVNDSSGYLSDAVNKSIVEKTPLTYDQYMALEEYYRNLADDPKEDYILYRTVDSANNRILKQNEWRYYKCNFRLVNGTKIDQIQTLFMQANLPYTYTISKKTTVNVKSESFIPAHCKETPETLSAINPGQPEPQTTDAILDDLAYRIYYCYNQKGNRFIAANEACGDYKVDIAGCAGTQIMSSDIYNKLSNNAKFPYYKDALSRNIYFDNEKDQNLFYLAADGVHYENASTQSDVAFNDASVYRINIFYHAPTFPDARSGYFGNNYMTVRYTSVPTNDTGCA